MDESAFDGWTRRRFGFGAGGAVAALFGWDAADAGQKKRRRRRKKRQRCRRVGATCTPGGKRSCCKHLRCEQPGLFVTFCCAPGGEFCDADFDCCPGLVCDPELDQCAIPLPPSDRAVKANFNTVDPTDMLERVRSLPISTWNYKSDDPAIRHIGPMAQDFAAAFGIGADDRHIHPIDGQGVALAAIQGLVLEVERLRAENGELAARVAGLEISRALAGR